MTRAPLLAIFALATIAPATVWAAEASAAPWWVWPIALFTVTFLLGIVAVLAGVGGGVLFVPIVGGFFPFHLDFVRGAGLLLALSGSLSAAPELLRRGFASLRLALPLALAGSTTAIFGAMVGLALPTAVVQTALGVVVLLIVLLTWRMPDVDEPRASRPDALSAALRLSGVFHDRAAARDIDWQAHRTPLGLAAFAAIGLMGGMLGLGAGWANVPALNLVMGVPIKLAVGTSTLAISISNTSAAWVYLNHGALLPILHVPSILGVMLGARVGAHLLQRVQSGTARRIMLVLLAIAGVRALAKGLGIWE